uniref:Uncharacterized protein n=1 Tax=Tanacetum cinerariifolium TaxID=118510 RepID=A0A6L2MV33_TANCI|nr:hypothetical protein [Tanacetum cinerariifolium]
MRENRLKILSNVPQILNWSNSSQEEQRKRFTWEETTNTPVVDVDVSEESDSKPAKKRTASRRVVKKKVTISIADNIIPYPDVDMELGKSISLTEVAKKEAARQVHDTHTRIVTESEPELAKKKTGSIKQEAADCMQALKESKKTSRRQPGTELAKKKTGSIKQEAADCMQALKESKKTSRRQPGTRGSNKGTGVSPGVLDESTVIPATSSERTDEEKKDDTDDDKSIDLEMTDDEENDDEFVHGVEQVNDDEDEEMTNAEVEESRNSDGENTDAAKMDAKKIEEIKDDAKKAELPPTSSSLSVSLCFVHVTTTHLPSVSTIPPVHHQTKAPILTPPITTDAPTITTVVPESNALSAIQLRVAKLKKDVSELKKIDHSDKALATLKSQVPTKHSVKLAPESSKIQKPAINLEQESKKSASKIRKIKREQAEKQKMPKYTIKSTDKATLKEGEEPKSQSLPRNHPPPKKTPKGKAPSKGSKTIKSTSAKEPDKEPIAEVVMDDAVNTTAKLDWNNPEGDHFPFDMSKPLLLQGRPGHLTVTVDYFFNNDLEYLKTSDPEKTYTTSITKTKVARVKKLHGYGNLEEVVVQIANRKLRKFKEGNFVDLHLNDIEDMLLLAVQHKLFHLNESDIVDFIAALRMFTKSLIIKHRVEDLQLGVESYEKKLNITAPQQSFPEIKFKELYIPSYKPPGSALQHESSL